VGHIRLEVAVAPRVEGVAVARDGPDDPGGFRAGGGGQRWQLESDARGDVQDELGVAAGVRHHRDSLPGGPARGLARGERLRHLVHVVDLDGPVCAQHGFDHAGLAGEAAGVAGDRAPRPLAATDLQDHHRLAAVGRAIERGDEPLRLAHRLEKHRDRAGRRIVDQVLEDVGRHDHRLVARRHHPAPAEAPAVGEEADDDRSALGDEPDAAGEGRGIAERVQIDEAPLVGADDAHAVGPAEGDAGLPTDGHQLVLAATARVVALGESRVEGDGGADPALGRHA
jgi:hypothetical protein